MNAEALTNRNNRALTATALAAFAGFCVAILFFFDPAQHSFYPVCFTRIVTGLNCPGCGSLRAMHQLLHGHLFAAARLNLLLVICLPQFAWWATRSGMRWLSGQPSGFAIKPAWLWAFLAVASGFTVLRNLSGFEWLAP